MEQEFVCSQCGGLNTAERHKKRKPCEACARENLRESWRAMREKTGPMYEKWLRCWRAATGLEIGGRHARPKVAS